MKEFLQASQDRETLFIAADVTLRGVAAPYSGKHLSEMIAGSSALYILVGAEELLLTPVAGEIEKSLRRPNSPLGILFRRGIFGVTRQAWDVLSPHTQDAKGLDIFVTILEVNKKTRVTAHAIEGDLSELRKHCDDSLVSSFSRLDCQFAVLTVGSVTDSTVLKNQEMSWISLEQLQEAIGQVQQGQYEAALPVVTRAAFQGRVNSSLFYLKAVVEANVGRHVDAMRSCVSAVEIDPKNTAARELLALLRNQRPQHQAH